MMKIDAAKRTIDESLLLSPGTGSDLFQFREALSREAQLLQSAPGAIVAGAIERAHTLRQRPELIADQLSQGAIIGAALSLAIRNPSALWGFSSLVSRNAGLIGTGLVLCDAAQRTALPIADVWCNRQSLSGNSTKLGDAIGSMVVDYSFLGLGGIAGAKIASSGASRIATLLSDQTVFCPQFAQSSGLAVHGGQLEAFPKVSKIADTVLKMESDEALSRSSTSAKPVCEPVESAPKKSLLEEAKIELARVQDKWDRYMGNNPNKYSGEINYWTREVERLTAQANRAARALSLPERLAQMSEPERIKYSLNTWYHAAKDKQFVEFENKLYQRRLDSSMPGKGNGQAYRESKWFEVTKVDGSNKMPILKEKDVHYNRPAKGPNG